MKIADKKPHKGQHRQRGIVFTRINNYFSKKQRSIADYLNARTAHASKGSVKAALAVFCFLFGTASLCIIIHSLTTKEAPVLPTYTDHIQHTAAPEWHKPQPTADKEMKRIEVFRKYAEALRDTNKSAYDSLNRERPGLMDSIKSVEQLYNK